MLKMGHEKCFLCGNRLSPKSEERSKINTNDERNVDDTVEPKQFRVNANSSIRFLIESVLRIRIEDLKDDILPSIRLCSKCSTELISLQELALELSRLEGVIKTLTDGMVNSVMKSLVQFSQGYEDATHFALTIALQNLRKIPLYFQIYKKWRLRFMKTFNSTNTTPSSTSSAKVFVAESTENTQNVIAIADDKLRMELNGLQEIQTALSHDHAYGCALDVDAPVISSSEKISLNSTEDRVESKHFYECQICKRKFRRQATLREHIKNGHNNLTNYCTNCKIHFSSRESFVKHIDETHQGIEDKLCGVCSDLCEPGVGVCKACRDSDHKVKRRKIRRTRLETSEDVTTDHLGAPKGCQSQELGNKNITNRSVPRNSVKNNCQYCQRTFRKKRELKCHLRSHTGERPYQCDQCKKTFLDKRQLKIHSRIHSREVFYICELCGTGFSSLAGFHSHRKTHAKLKPYSCEQCAGKFRSSGQLKKHQLIHTGEKPFSCTICQKSFNRKENLRAHEFTHATLKPHKCDLCPQSFIRSFLLRKHVLEHHSEPVTSLIPTNCPPSIVCEPSVGLEGPVRMMTLDVLNANQPHLTITSTNISTGTLNLIPEAVFIADTGEQYIIYK